MAGGWVGGGLAVLLAVCVVDGSAGEVGCVAGGVGCGVAIGEFVGARCCGIVARWGACGCGVLGCAAGVIVFVGGMYVPVA